MHRRARKSRAARGGAAAIEQDVCSLARAVAEITIALRNAEAKIEADARQRIRTLREEAKKDLAALYGRHREAERLVSRLATASGIGCPEIERAARRAVRETRAIANAMIERFQRAISE